MIRVLIIGYVWPEPRSSAAGLRDLNLIECLKSYGWEVWFASASQSNPHQDELEALGVRTQGLELNRSSANTWFQELNPDLVIFDRFVTEEQFGSRIRESCPNAVTVVDTQDLHSLRRFRASHLESESDQTHHLFESEDFLREMAALLRSDGALILSDYELGLLQAERLFAEDKLHLLKFIYPNAPARKPFGERAGFTTIGNFRHAPNWDAVQWLCREIWPEIRIQLPAAELFVYGSYPSREAMAFHRPDLGIHIVGQVRDHIGALETHRVSLAPLRFGAGIKGKISDSWFAGTPVVTTPIGSEGMSGEDAFAGKVCSDLSDFVKNSVILHEDPDLWTSTQKAGYKILSKHYSWTQSDHLHRYLKTLIHRREDNRRKNWIGRLLLHQSMQASKYMTRWIELKEQSSGILGRDATPRLSEPSARLSIGRAPDGTIPSPHTKS